MSAGNICATSGLFGLETIPTGFFAADWGMAKGNCTEMEHGVSEVRSAPGCEELLCRAASQQVSSEISHCLDCSLFGRNFDQFNSPIFGAAIFGLVGCDRSVRPCAEGNEPGVGDPVLRNQGIYD